MIAAKRQRLFGKAFMTVLMVLALLVIGTGTGHAEHIVPMRNSPVRKQQRLNPLSALTGTIPWHTKRILQISA